MLNSKWTWLAGPLWLLLSAALLADPLQVAPQEGLLLLRTGHVLRGEITRSGDEYYITLPKGEIRVPAAEVELFCRTLDEAYRQKRSALRTGHVSEHLDLADWCLRHELHGYAAKELLSAKAADPTHPKLELIERRLKLAMKPVPSAESKGSALAERKGLSEVEELMQRLPPGAMETFTSTIQPLLVNSCSTAACHGSGSNNRLKLERIGPARVLTHRTTQRNLLAVMRTIDGDNPAASPLLIKPLTPHGDSPTAALTKNDLPKYRKLMEWVDQVATPAVQQAPATVGQPAAPLLQTIPGASGTPANSPAAESPTKEAPPVDQPQPADDKSPPAKNQHDGGSPTNSVGAAQKRRGLQFGAPLPEAATDDPFDPEIFNRQEAK